MQIRIEAEVPREVVNVEKLRLGVLNALRRTGTKTRQMFRKTTATWNTQPVFTQKISFRGGEPAVEVGTDNEIYGYVNDGVPARDIYPVNKPLLKYQKGYTAKTRVRVIGSRPGGKHGAWTSRKSVHWPGIEARHFSDEIASEMELELENAVYEAIDEALAEERAAEYRAAYAGAFRG